METEDINIFTRRMRLITSAIIVDGVHVYSTSEPVESICWF